MSKQLIEEIANITGRKVSECMCEKCKSQCRIPCLGTPDDILCLIEAGYANRLVFTHWAVGAMLGVVPEIIMMVQPMRVDSGCIFFKEGLCELHQAGLKPTEGKLSHHTIRFDNYIFELSVTWKVAKEWMEERNLKKIIRIVSLMEYYKR